MNVTRDIAERWIERCFEGGTDKACLDAPGKVWILLKSMRKHAPVETYVSPSLTPEDDTDIQNNRGKGSKSSAANWQCLLTATTIEQHGSRGQRPARKTHIAARLGSLPLWRGLSAVVSFFGNWPGSRLPCSKDMTWHSALTPPEAFCRVQ